MGWCVSQKWNLYFDPLETFNYPTHLLQESAKGVYSYKDVVSSDSPVDSFFHPHCSATKSPGGERWGWALMVGGYLGGWLNKANKCIVWQWMAIPKQYSGQTRKITSSPSRRSWGELWPSTCSRICWGWPSSICPDSISAVLSPNKKRKFWPFYRAIKSGITFLYILQPTCKHS